MSAGGCWSPAKGGGGSLHRSSTKQRRWEGEGRNQSGYTLPLPSGVLTLGKRRCEGLGQVALSWVQRALGGAARPLFFGTCSPRFSLEQRPSPDTRPSLSAYLDCRARADAGLPWGFQRLRGHSEMRQGQWTVGAVLFPIWQSG